MEVIMETETTKGEKKMENNRAVKRICEEGPMEGLEMEKDNQRKSEKASVKAGTGAVAADNKMSHCNRGACIQESEPLLGTNQGVNEEQSKYMSKEGNQVGY